MLLNRPEGVRIQDGLGYLSVRPAAGGIAFVQAATQVNLAATTDTTPNITINSVLAGNCIVGVASIYDGESTYTITDTTDSGSNTYTTRSAVLSLGTTRQRAIVAYAVNVNAGSPELSFNLADTSGTLYLVLGAMEFSGVKTSSPEDTFDVNDDVDITATDISAGPITTTDAGDLIVGCASGADSDNNANWSSPTSWNNTYRQNDHGTYVASDAGYWLPGSIQTTYTAQWAHDNPAIGEACAVIVALLPA